jgi:hypothetical protein
LINYKAEKKKCQGPGMLISKIGYKRPRLDNCHRLFFLSKRAKKSLRLAVEIDEDVGCDGSCYNHDGIDNGGLKVEANVKKGDGK